jgi:hypothetical protein
MKNEIILWLSSLIIVFIIGYIKNVTDKDYPVTGTFGIEGKKVSYKLDKVSFDKTSYKNIIISDIKGVEAKILFIEDGQRKNISYEVIDRGLKVEIPKLKPGKKIEYKVMINYNDKDFEIPKNGYVTLTFWGNIPAPISILNFILLYAGLLMSIRNLLESFTKVSNLKKFVFITCTLFIIFIIILYPLYNTYKLGAINHFVPPFSDLVNPLLTLILGVWIIAAVFIFNKKYIRTVTTLATCATVLVYFLF